MKTADDLVERRVREALDAVHDPEIPACAITDLGMVERVAVTDDRVEVDLLPTFVGCPAKDIIGDDVRRAVAAAAGERDVTVRFVYEPPWTTDRITERGRERLRGIGIAPHWDRPGSGPVTISLMTSSPVPCPFCGATDTVMESRWGPTPCRTQHFCRSCRNPFEGFKEKGTP
ncbi:MAG TPA: 1,2-phenylacetyl-CoA epoxidase subunit PaaD [Actinomycetota bacterium]|nr:1,2-phenylacetyl-CoA epoxidase subunit PaaD [Actinomycetota bacterium]